MQKEGEGYKIKSTLLGPFLWDQLLSCVSITRFYKGKHERLLCFGPPGGYPDSTLAPQDFTHPNGEMNSPTDYMSKTLCGSSVSETQVEHLLNTEVPQTHKHAHTHTCTQAHIPNNP